MPHLTPDAFRAEHYRRVTYHPGTSVDPGRWRHGRREPRRDYASLRAHRGAGGVPQVVHEFAENEIRPVAAQYDESEEFPWPVVKKAAEIGLYSLDY